MKIATYTTQTKDISLYNFIKVYEQKNFRLLKTRGIYTKKQGARAYDLLISEFTELIGAGSSNHILSLVKYVVFMQGKINLIIYCLHSLDSGWNREIAALVNKLGIRKAITRANYRQAINVAYSELKKMKQSLLEKNAELEEQTKDRGGFEFEKVLIDIAKFQGYHINSKEITAYDFCMLVESCKEQAKKQKKNG